MSKTNLVPDIIGSSAMPPELRELVGDLIEGRVRTLLFVAELTDGQADGIYVNIDGHDTNTLAIIGALEVLKRDFMRAYTASRVEYVSFDDVIDDDDGEQETQPNGEN